MSVGKDLMCCSRRYALTLLCVAGFAALPTRAAGAEEVLKSRAVVKARAEATISVFLTAKVVQLPFRNGQAFHKNDELVKFDCSRYVADLESKQAAYAARRETVTNNKRLLRHQAIGASEVSVSVAQMNEARALVEVQRALVRQCVVKAPWDGRVVEQLVNEHETPGPSKPLLKIVATAAPELELIVPSRWLVWLKVGKKFFFKVDETGEVLPVEVTRLGAVVDAVSQTIKMTGRISGNKNSVLPGMSGTATFSFSGS